MLYNAQDTHNIAAFGVVFLLFVIGLELTLDRIWQMKKYVFGYGASQVFITSTVLYILGVLFTDIQYIAIFALALTFSSTAVVLQILSESKRQDSLVGRLALSILLMQDLAVVPMLAILPIVATGSRDVGAQIFAAAIKALIAIAAIIITGRLLLRPFFRFIASAKTNEAFVSTTLLLVLGSSILTEELGLSGEMGAFMAGVMIAETEYSHKVEKSVLPFKDLLLGLFFLSVGMELNVRFVIEYILEIACGAMLLIAIKAIIIFAILKIYKFRTGASIHLSLLLSQGGEFAFIVFSMIAKYTSVIDQFVIHILLTSITISMAITPLLAAIGSSAESYYDLHNETEQGGEFSAVSELYSHVVIIGFGVVGRIVSYMLSNQNIRYVAVDASIVVAKKARKEGLPVYHGDIAKTDIMRAVALKRACALIITVDDYSYGKRAIDGISQHYPHLDIITLTSDYNNAKELRKYGATITVPQKVEMGLALSESMMRNFGIAENKIFDMKQTIRENNYYAIGELDLMKVNQRLSNNAPKSS